MVLKKIYLYEIVPNFPHISHNLTWYSAIVPKFTRIFPVCSTYELTKPFLKRISQSISKRITCKSKCKLYRLFSLIFLSFQVFFINHNDKKTTWVDPRTGRPSALPVQSNVPNRRHEDDLGNESIGNFLLLTINKLVFV